MEAALGWLGEIFKYLLSFIPRPLIARTTQGGVKWIKGKKVKEIKPGFGFYWPFTTSYEIIAVVRQGMVIKPKGLATRDLTNVSMGFTMVFRISNVVKALTEVDNIFETIDEAGQTAAPGIVAASSDRELVDQMVVESPDSDEEDESEDSNTQPLSLLDKKMTEATQRILKDFGVEMIWCKVNEFSIPNQTLKHIGEMVRIGQ